MVSSFIDPLVVGERPLLASGQADRHITTRAMARFVCRAGDCEDTCCRDWAVVLDRASIDRLQQVMSKTAEDRARFVRLVVVGRPAAVSPEPAHLKMDDRAVCEMLDADRRCGIQTRWGEQAMVTACSIFPRTALAHGPYLEVGGSLACPEVARLSLLDDDGLLPVTGGPSILPRAYVGKEISADPDDRYAAHFAPVRAALLDLFAREEFPLGSNLIFAANLAAQVEPFFHRDSAALRGAQRLFTERHLSEELSAAGQPEALQVLHAELQSFTGADHAAVANTASLLLERRRLPHSPRFAALLQQAFGSLQEEALGRPADPSDSVTALALAAVYRRRREALTRRLPEQADRLFRRYCRHFLLRHPFTDSASLLEHLGKLALQLGAVRLLTLAHPALAARLAAPADARADHDTFAQVAIESIQTFTKAVSHQIEALEVMYQAARESGGFSFGRLSILAKQI